VKRFPATAAMRRHLVASVACGVVVAGSTIVGAVLLAHLVAGVVTDDAPRTVAHWAPTLWSLLGTWVIRVIAQWLQARLGQHGATAGVQRPERLAGVRVRTAALATDNAALRGDTGGESGSSNARNGRGDAVTAPAHAAAPW